MTVVSANFGFLKVHDPLLVELATHAERYLAADPNTCLIKLRQFAETLAQQAAAYVGGYTGPEESLIDLLNRLSERGVLDKQTAGLFHGIRRLGNAAVHEHVGTQRDALEQLRAAHHLAVWFHQSFTDPKFTPRTYFPPADPAQLERQRLAEIEALKKTLAATQEAATAAQIAAEAEAKRGAEIEALANKYSDDVATWQALAEETEAAVAAERARFAAETAALQAKATAEPVVVSERIQRVQQASKKLHLSEAETRLLVDEQLRQAGWEVDTETLTNSKGARPQRGKRMAIAEWPTENGPADYVLFHGVQVLAVVEAKRKHKDVPASIEQAKRYSKGYIVKGEETLPGGPWGEYRVPFLFATNGRDYLKQLEMASGIWFLDARRKMPSRALDGWYSPEGLRALLDVHEEAADAKLQSETPDFPWIRPEICRDLPVPIPPLAEQELIICKIADALSAMDTLERAVAPQRVNLNRFDQSVLSKAFRGEFVPQDPHDEPASLLLERIRNGARPSDSDGSQKTSKLGRTRNRRKENQGEHD